MSELLEVRDLACERGGRRLFEGLSFAVPPGGAALVRGPNGVGKSSLVRVLAGLLRPAAGSVARPERVALMAEAAALDGERRLGEALAFWARLDDAADAPRRAARGLAAVGLGALAALPVRLLSTGQRRRAALARVVASGADLWLLDEPANGLDVAAVATLEALIAEHRAGGGIVVVATHQPVALPGAVEVNLSNLPGTGRGTAEGGGGGFPHRDPFAASPLHHASHRPPPRAGEVS